MDNKTLTCFALLLFLGCAFGSLRDIREQVSAKFRKGSRPSYPQASPKDPDAPTLAPRNCDPKRIPRFPSFDASIFDGVSLATVQVLPTNQSNPPGLGNFLDEFQVLSYMRPDGTKEQILIQTIVTAQEDGTCRNDTIVFKFGQGRDSSMYMTVGTIFGAIFNFNAYVLGFDMERGEAAVYLELLVDGVFDDASFIFIATQNPSVPVDLTQSAIREGLVQFCGEEALQEDFFEKLERNDPIECWG